MKIGVPKEIKPQENRIGLTPESVKTLTSNGHEVLIENNGGFFKNLSSGVITKEIEKNNKKEIGLYQTKNKILVGDYQSTFTELTWWYGNCDNKLILIK